MFWITPAGFSLTPGRLYAGPLPSLGTVPFFTLPPGSLPPGTYVWITVVDNDANGVLDGHFFDFVVTTIAP